MVPDRGDAEPTGWRLALVLAMLVLYTVAAVVTAVGGVQLWRDLGGSGRPPAGPTGPPGGAVGCLAPGRVTNST